jgi:hypothetical protein
VLLRQIDSGLDLLPRLRIWRRHPARVHIDDERQNEGGAYPLRIQRYQHQGGLARVRQAGLVEQGVAQAVEHERLAQRARDPCGRLKHVRMRTDDQRRTSSSKLIRQVFLPLRSPALVFHAPVHRDDHHGSARPGRADDAGSCRLIQGCQDIIEGEEGQFQAVDLPVERLGIRSDGSESQVGE